MELVDIADLKSAGIAVRVRVTSRAPTETDMRYILAVINTEKREYSFDKEFSSMKELWVFVNHHRLQWTSLMVTILPSAPKRKAIVRHKRSPRFLGSM